MTAPSRPRPRCTAAPASPAGAAARRCAASCRRSAPPTGARAARSAEPPVERGLPRELLAACGDAAVSNLFALCLGVRPCASMSSPTAPAHAKLHRSRLDAWPAGARRGPCRPVLARFLIDHDLIDEPQTAALGRAARTPASDRLVLAFVAEFSRGKSELINAIFFADAGRRVLPATPGPHDDVPGRAVPRPSAAPHAAVAAAHRDPPARAVAGRTARARRPWQHVPLEIDNPEAWRARWQAVTRTQRVTVETAERLGFWSDEQPDDNPPRSRPTARSRCRPGAMR
jgi:hypothetical protein